MQFRACMQKVKERIMSKKIVILNGSPRRKGNTAVLTAEFAKGAKEAGNTVTEFFLDEMNINGCLGCFGGGGARIRGERILV